MVDSYKTIANSSKALLKEKQSKFFAFAYPVSSLEAVKAQIDECKKNHHTARHWCYAYRLGSEGLEYRSNDDGEPSHSAGDPILRHIDSFELTNVLIIVVRYFGGVKLGVGGLIQAYGGAAGLALEVAKLITVDVKERIHIQFGYPEMNDVMRILKKHDAEMVEHAFEITCWLIAETPRAAFDAFEAELSLMHTLKLKRQ